MSKDRSPNVSDHRSPAAAQKKRAPRVGELEAQIGLLQEELKKAKAKTRKAQQEADEAKWKLLGMSEKLDKSEKQLQELSEYEEARFQELRKVSRDRDRVWESELVARQKLHHIDSLALSSAINQVKKLKIQLKIRNARHPESVHQSLEEMESYKSLALELKESQEKTVSLEESIEEIRENLNKEFQLNNISEQKILEELKAELTEKEREVQILAEENDKLKMEMKNKVLERIKLNDESLALVGAIEKEALMKLNDLTEEADKSTRKAVWATEQLDAAQAARADVEAKLRRLKVQADQWRKSAEAAVGMLSSGNNGKFVERTGSMGHYTIGGKLSLPYSEDLDDDSSPKKKNGNMLKKIGVLLKKGQKY